MTKPKTTIGIVLAILLLALTPALWAAGQIGDAGLATQDGGDGHGDGGDGGDGHGDGGDGDGHGDGGGGGHQDGPGELEFHQRTYFATEHGGMAMISVERSGGHEGLVTVDYATADGSAMDGEDYVAASGTLTWEDGRSMMQTFWIEILADDLDEPDETVELALFNPTGGAELDPEHSTAVLTLLDDGQGGGGHGGGGGGMEGAGEIGFSGQGHGHGPQVIEGMTEARIMVRRSHGLQGAVTVDYATSDGSATAGLDYEAAAGTLSWADGETGPKEILVPILEDDVEEGNETVLLSLSNLTGDATLDDGETTLTILDHDGSTVPCQAGDQMACLLGDRFQVEIIWRSFDGTSGRGQAVPHSNKTSLFWFFNEANIELIVKVLDACNRPGLGRYWVFMSALTNVDFTMTVTDTMTGVVKEYSNPLGEAAMPVQDTLTFETCD